MPETRAARTQTPTKPAALLLWDIDGTIMHCWGAGRESLVGAMRKCFGVEASMEGISFGGRTDVWIARQLFPRHDIPVTEKNIERFLAAYIRLLPGELERRSLHICEGVRSCLEAAATSGKFAQGVLTGNVRQGADAKLKAANLHHFFAIGAWGCDAEDRNELGPCALMRAEAHYGLRFAGEKVCIIGDTPHDIACARAIGAHCIALAQGSYKLAELESHGPTVALERLPEPDEFVSTLTRILKV